MTRGFRTSGVVALCLLMALPVEAAQAQAPVLPKTQREASRAGVSASADGVVLSDQDARGVHQDLNEVMKKYPPTVGEVIKMDPSLMGNATFLATYPALQTFLASHPEVVKNPEFFFDAFGSVSRPRSSSQDFLWRILEDATTLTIFGVVVGAITWFIRLMVDYRRWNRLAKVQAEAHTKLLDRFTANDELIAYVQSPAGSRFLQSAPIALDPGTRRLGAPISRILWSAQAGLVVMMGGIALKYVSNNVDVDAQQPLFAIGTVAIAVGVGFLLSAAVSYALSQRLGLFDADKVGSAPSPRAGSASGV